MRSVEREKERERGQGKETTLYCLKVSALASSICISLFLFLSFHSLRKPAGHECSFFLSSAHPIEIESRKKALQKSISIRKVAG